MLDVSWFDGLSIGLRLVWLGMFWGVVRLLFCGIVGCFRFSHVFLIWMCMAGLGWFVILLNLRV